MGSFGGLSSLSWYPCCFTVWSTLLYALLDFNVLIEKSAVAVMALPLCVPWAFSSCCFQYTFSIINALMAVKHEEFLSLPCVFGVLCTCYTWIGRLFLYLRSLLLWFYWKYFLCLWLRILLLVCSTFICHFMMFPNPWVFCSFTFKDLLLFLNDPLICLICKP